MSSSACTPRVSDYEMDDMTMKPEPDSYKLVEKEDDRLTKD